MITSPSLAAEQQFLAFLSVNGHPLDGSLNHDSSMFHYLRCPQGSKTDARYKFFLDDIPAGYFECWRCGIKDNFCSKQKQDVSPQEWEKHTKRLADEKQKNKAETQQVYTEVALLAQDVFATASEAKASEHSYLKQKQVKNYGLRTVTTEDQRTNQAKCYKENLLVPCYNAEGVLVNLERIYFDNKKSKHQKRPLPKGQRIGAFFLLGEITNKKTPIVVTEGYASAATAHEATKFPSAVTFGAGNLVNVAKILREGYPDNPILISADDDKWGDDPKVKDKGSSAAKTACAAVSNTNYVLPDFSVLDLSDEALQQEKPTDINDLFVLLLKHNHERNAALEIISQQLILPSTSHSEVLKKLLAKISPVDFRARAKLDEKDKIKVRHYLITCIEEILKLAKNNKWGLCRNNEFTYIYNGEYWEALETEALKTFLGDAAGKMGVDEFSSKYFNFRDQLYKQFIALAALSKPNQQRETILINLKNGTFKVTPHALELKPFDQTDFMTYQLPFEYIEDAPSPKFSDYLDKVLPDKALQDILAEFLGYVFIRTSTLKLEKALLLYGSGANGKSVLYEVVRKLFGEQNTSEYSLQSLTNENGYFRAMLANKLVNYASEINGKLGASIFKQLVSGEA